MPTYEYRCQSCQHELEAFQSIKDAPLTDCPACHEHKLERLISATSFQLKGGGWYKDLYSSSKPATNSPKSNKAA
ncbi:MAG: FmdB family zinc ribbon protein [Mycobacterium sp.]